MKLTLLIIGWTLSLIAVPCAVGTDSPIKLVLVGWTFPCVPHTVLGNITLASCRSAYSAIRSKLTGAGTAGATCTAQCPRNQLAGAGITTGVCALLEGVRDERKGGMDDTRGWYLSLPSFHEIKQQLLECSKKQWEAFLINVVQTTICGSHKIWVTRNWTDSNSQHHHP